MCSMKAKEEQNERGKKVPPHPPTPHAEGMAKAGTPVCILRGEACSGCGGVREVPWSGTCPAAGPWASLEIRSARRQSPSSAFSPKPFRIKLLVQALKAVPSLKSLSAALLVFVLPAPSGSCLKHSEGVPSVLPAGRGGTGKEEWLLAPKELTNGTGQLSRR